MREFRRPKVKCNYCNFFIHFSTGLFEATELDPLTDIVAQWPEPPSVTESCPKCGNAIDTSAVYPYLQGFAPGFEELKAFYKGFSARWETHRESFEVALSDWVSQVPFEEVVKELNTPGGQQWYRQRLFYRSSVAFYRALQLFLADVQMDRNSFQTWSNVTGYYSRFYFLQAFLNLCGATFFELPLKPKGFLQGITYFDGQKVSAISKMPPAFGAGSHERWWGLMEALRRPSYPVQHLEFVLTRLVHNPAERNRINYGFEYQIGGFPELEWADSGADQMMAHFSPSHRADRDITDIDRFFEEIPDDEADVADFYSDNLQILWCSLQAYLELLKELQFDQNFVKTETILALCDLHIGNDYPKLVQGIALAVDAALRDGFDLNPFSDHYRSGHSGSVYSKGFAERLKVFPRWNRQGL